MVDKLGSVLPGQFRQAQDDVEGVVSGTQSTSTPLVYGINRITASANDSDGVLLPPALKKAEVWIFNDDAAQDVQVFGTGSDTVNGTAGATGVAQGQQTVAYAFCVTDGEWHLVVLGSTIPT